MASLPLLKFPLINSLAAYELPIGEHVEKIIKVLAICLGRLPFATLRVNSRLFMLRLRKKLLGGQYLDKKDAGC
jgi:hypothetical protein